jgi:hypothetical protein
METKLKYTSVLLVDLQLARYTTSTTLHGVTFQIIFIATGEKNSSPVYLTSLSIFEDETCDQIEKRMDGTATAQEIIIWSEKYFN